MREQPQEQGKPSIFISLVDRLIRTFIAAPKETNLRRSGYLDEDPADGWVRMSSVGRVKKAGR